MTNELKIPPRPGGEAKLPPLPRNERQPLPVNEQPVQSLKKGDALTEWSGWYKGSQSSYRTRRVVGSRMTFLSYNDTCKFCGTRGHWESVETENRRVGRDKKEYSYVSMRKTDDSICPKCGYRW